jgi:glucose dehydrogenase
MIIVEENDREIVAAQKAEKADWKTKMEDISQMTFSSLDEYIDDNVTNLAEAKKFQKKLSKAVLALMKLFEEVNKK